MTLRSLTSRRLGFFYVLLGVFVFRYTPKEGPLAWLIDIPLAAFLMPLVLACMIANPRVASQVLRIVRGLALKGSAWR